jgi:hypothetical protein
LFVLAVAAGSSLHAFAAAPAISRLQPAAAIPGVETSVRLIGENLDGPARLWTSFPCGGSLERDTDSTAFNIKVPPKTELGYGAIRLVTTNGMSALQLFLIDPVPGIVSGATNDSIATAQPLTRRTAVDGVCAELRSAFYRIAAKKGARLSVEVVAQRLGSPLDPLLRVLDGTGRELIAVDDSPGLGADARLEFHAPKAGDYFVEVRDTRHAGGPRHRYRLRLADPLPNPLPFRGDHGLARFTAPLAKAPLSAEHEPNEKNPQRVAVPVELTGRLATAGDQDLFEFRVKKGERLVFTGRTRSLGSPCDLFLQLQSTNGATIAESNATGADEGVLTNRFAEAGVYRLRVEELNRLGGPDFNYRLGIAPLRPGFELSADAERFPVPAGDSIEIEVQAQRRDYDGPIHLKLAGLEAGFVATNTVIVAKTNSTKIRLTVPADLALGELFPFGITGSAEINGSNITVRVSTRPALRAAFPEMRFPPAELDGLMSLSVSGSKSTAPKPARRKRTGAK